MCIPCPSSGTVVFSVQNSHFRHLTPGFKAVIRCCQRGTHLELNKCKFIAYTIKKIQSTFSVCKEHMISLLNLFLQLRVGSPLQSWNSAALELFMRFWHGGVNYLRLCQGMQHAVYHLWCNNVCLHNGTKRMGGNIERGFFV